MEQGPVEKIILEQCIRDNLPIPKKLQNSPSLESGMELYYQAFLDLNSCRQVGMGEGPIPWTAIAYYCRFFEMDEETTDDVMYMVRGLDNEYLKIKAENKPNG